MSVHPTAIVHPNARLSEDVEIGPFCVIGDEVQIERGTRLRAHVYIEGPTTIGRENLFFPYCSVGVEPQDLKYRGEKSMTRIGHRNRIREFVTIHRGTSGGGMLTSVGDDNLVMAYVHIAHDVKIGNGTILGNAVTFAGHVIVEDAANVEAFSGVHQFCRIGRYAFIGGYSVITQDVLPFSMTVTPRESRVFGANKIGLERRGFSKERIDELQKAFRLLTKSGLNTTQALERIAAEVPDSPELEELVGFIAGAQRGFIK